MKALFVGGKFPPCAGREEGCFFEADASGYMYIANFSAPTQKEIEAAKDGDFEIRFVTTGPVIWILVKFGNLEWQEAPFTPHLSRDVGSLREPLADTTLGTALTLLMVDANTNTIHALRLIGLGNRFSRALYAEIQRLSKETFDEEQFNKAIFDTQHSKTTNDLVRYAKEYFKVRR